MSSSFPNSGTSASNQSGGFPGGGSAPSRLPRTTKVKNKAPAPLQITAEQIIREAQERQFEVDAKVPTQQIASTEELEAYKVSKRKQFEEIIRSSKRNIGNWIRYATFEEQHKEFARARSVFERALDADPRNIQIFIKYAEMEMKNKFINHARNVWDRAVTLLPRVSAFWFKYTYMEEMLGNVPGARIVFDRWMAWEPEPQAWQTYINMELRYNEINKARNIYERFVSVHHEVKNWIKFARFEESHGQTARARAIYERAVAFFGEEFMDEKLFVAFAKFEESSREYERARVIYKYALERLPKNRAEELLKNYTQFEKKHGEKQGIEDVILSKRRFQYEEEIKANPSNYDAWFDYIRLEENNGDIDRTRDVYERAIANLPPAEEKRLWRRYIYFWIYYALFEELEAKDIERAREVYRAVLQLIPHSKFTFSKIWLLFARFEIRQKNLTAARKTLGQALGVCPKDQIYRGYIDLELQLREFDRCRILYEKFIQFNEANSTTWVKFAELETVLGDTERARAIYELAISRPTLDMPEVVWKAYIDFETELQELDKTRSLYERLLERTDHVKVWISYAQFEVSVDPDGDKSQARKVFEKADKQLRKDHQKEQRVLLLEAWKDFETAHGDATTQADVNKKMPSKIKKRRKVHTDDGSDAGWEEYFEYIFPDEQENAPNLKLLQMAQMWKMQQMQAKPASSASSESTSAAAVASAPAAAHDAESEERDEAPEEEGVAEKEETGANGESE